MLKKNIDCWYDDGRNPVKLQVQDAVFEVLDISAGDHGMSFMINCYRDGTKADLLYSVPYSLSKKWLGLMQRQKHTAT